ncbi:hypothetical protein WMF18_23900 [Sorangium sp. So ce315]|uniref:hypothetical protein n=1 Tax=Sorangium sp. So ce315 TaxID=3133299 RepID=UPI003F5F2FA8
MSNAPQPSTGEPWRPGVPQPVVSPPISSPGPQPENPGPQPENPGAQPENPGAPGRTSPDREIHLPGTTEQPTPGGAPEKHRPEVPAPPHTHEIPDPSPYEVPRHDFPRA